MILAIWLFILIINLFFGIIKKNNKIVLILSVVLIVLILGGNNYNADYAGYLRYYNAQIYPTTMEIGYTYLSSFFHTLGLEYQYYVLLLMAVSAIIISIVSAYYKANGHIVIFLYASTMIFLDAVQTRQSIAYAMFLLALMVLSHKKKILSAVCIVIAFLFQWTAIVFLPIVFLDSSKRLSKHALRIIVSIISGLCVIVFASGNRISFLMPLIQKFVTGQKLLYFETSGRFGFLLYFAFQFACIYISYICRETLMSRESDDKIIAFANNVYMTTIYASLGMPFVMINNNFSRLFKYTMLGCFILISLVMMTCKNDKSSVPVKLGSRAAGTPATFGFIVVAYILIYEFVIQVPTVVTDVLTNNLFL